MKQFILLIILNILDCGFTIFAVKNGATEANPIMAALIESGWVIFVMTKMILALTSGYILYLHARRILTAACVIYLMLVVYHLTGIFG